MGLRSSLRSARGEGEVWGSESSGTVGQPFSATSCMEGKGQLQRGQEHPGVRGHSQGRSTEERERLTPIGPISAESSTGSPRAQGSRQRNGT